MKSVPTRVYKTIQMIRVYFLHYMRFQKVRRTCDSKRYTGGKNHGVSLLDQTSLLRTLKCMIEKFICILLFLDFQRNDAPGKI